MRNYYNQCGRRASPTCRPRLHCPFGRNGCGSERKSCNNRNRKTTKRDRSTGGDLHNRQQVSANPSDAFLCPFFGHGCRLGRELKYRCVLTITEHSQQDDASVREFERIVMGMRPVFIDLAKDRHGLTDGQGAPRCEGSRYEQTYLLGERKLCSRKKT